MKIAPAFLRFVVAGLVNTAFTLLLFELLRQMLPHLWAYSITYLLGIGLAYGLNTRFVFGSKRSRSSALKFPLIYVGQYLYGLLVMYWLVDRLGLNPTLAVVVVIASSVPLTFVASRWILVSRADSNSEPAKTE